MTTFGPGRGSGNFKGKLMSDKAICLFARRCKISFLGNLWCSSVKYSDARQRELPIGPFPAGKLRTHTVLTAAFVCHLSRHF